MQRSKVPLKVSGKSKRICCKAELVRVTSQISVGIAPPYLMLCSVFSVEPSSRLRIYDLRIVQAEKQQKRAKLGRESAANAYLENRNYFKTPDYQVTIIPVQCKDLKNAKRCRDGMPKSMQG